MARSRRNGSLSDPTLLILISLADGPRHGHAMMLDIEAFSGQRLGPGTLYGAIERLEGEALIEALSSEDRRQPYRLTVAGARSLDAQLDGLDRLAAIGAERRQVVKDAQA